MAQTTKEVATNSSSSTLTHESISQLKGNALKRLCEQHGVDVKLPKKAKQQFLCLELGISTAGQSQSITSTAVPKDKDNNLSQEQSSEYAKLTPQHLQSRNDWKKDVRTAPTLDITPIKKYLLNVSVISDKQARRYKETRPFQLKDFVHDIYFNGLKEYPTFCAFKGRCLPSLSTADEDIKVMQCIVDKITGDPVGGYCTCTAGLSQSCGHLGALLFKVEDVIASGSSQLPADLTCTEVPSYWAGPKGAKVDPQRLCDIQVGKQSVNQGLRRTEDEFGQLLLGANTRNRPLNPEDVMVLRHNLFMATQSLGVHVPAVHALNPNRFQTTGNPVPNPPLNHDMPEYCSALCPDIAPAFEVEVQCKPMPVALVPTDCFRHCDNSIEDQKTDLIKSLSLSAEERKMICKLTVGQNQNICWYQQRMGSITASKTWDIIKYEGGNTKISLDRLVRNVMGYPHEHLTCPPKPRKAPLKWGIVQERRAREAFVKHMSSSHKDLEIAEQGLVVHPDVPYIRASPDGITSCHCHGTRLLEIKCPYSARNMTPQAAIKEGVVDYLLEPTPGKYMLNKSKRGYFHQIQTTLAVCQLEACDMVIWTPSGMLVVEVPFDAISWSYFEHCLIQFFKKHITTELLTKELKNGGGMRGQAAMEVDSDEECVQAARAYEQETVNVQTKVEEASGSISLVCLCAGCRKVLPEPDYVADDNSNASVGCDCECLCGDWYCWPCASYTETEEAQGSDWICSLCVDKCA